MTELKLTGGAKYALLHASRPFAQLTVNKDKLSLTLPFCGLHFRPADVLSIQPYSLGMFSGVCINHNVANYKSPVVFSSAGDSRQLIAQISQTGFLDNKAPLPIDVETQINNFQMQGGFSMKVPATIAIVAIWNLLIIPNIYFALVKNQHQYLKTGPTLASGFMALLCLSLILSQPFRNLILKEGRPFSEIKILVYFLLVLCSIMLIATSLIPNIP